MQQNAHIFQYAILYLKHHALNMFRSVMGHFHGETQQSIMNETGTKIRNTKACVLYNFFLFFVVIDILFLLGINKFNV